MITGEEEKPREEEPQGRLEDPHLKQPVDVVRGIPGEVADTPPFSLGRVWRGQLQGAAAWCAEGKVWNGVPELEIPNILNEWMAEDLK